MNGGRVELVNCTLENSDFSLGCFNGARLIVDSCTFIRCNNACWSAGGGNDLKITGSTFRDCEVAVRTKIGDDLITEGLVFENCGIEIDTNVLNFSNYLCGGLLIFSVLVPVLVYFVKKKRGKDY